MSTQKDRAEQKRREKLQLIRDQLDSGQAEDSPDDARGTPEAPAPPAARETRPRLRPRRAQPENSVTE
jgi:hypothetical protein